MAGHFGTHRHAVARCLRGIQLSRTELYQRPTSRPCSSLLANTAAHRAGQDYARRCGFERLQEMLDIFRLGREADVALFAALVGQDPVGPPTRIATRK